MALHVGQKVVCINANPCSCCGDTGGLVLKAEYTVTRVFQFCGEDGVSLAETAPLKGKHSGFWASAFRPVIKPGREVSFTVGADPGSEKWDNRVKKRARA